MFDFIRNCQTGFQSGSIILSENHFIFITWSEFSIYGTFNRCIEVSLQAKQFIGVGPWSVLSIIF